MRSVGVAAATAVVAVLAPLGTAGATPVVTAGSHPVPTAGQHAAGGVPAPRHYLTDHMGSGLAARTLPRAPTTAAAGIGVAAAGGVPGMDVSGWQGNVDWAAAYAAGARFAVVKATEGTGYTNSSFAQQYLGSAAVGMTRGAYHFALPDTSSGTVQADYFVGHGGGWSADGRTLPPALDIEYDPYGPTCYRLTQPAMVGWIRAFVDEVHARTSRYPIIYTTADWWARCTGNSASFGSDPLWIARYNTSPGVLPAGWPFESIWQYADHGAFVGDQDAFDGTTAQLARFAGVAEPVAASVTPAVPAKISIGGAVTRIPVTVQTNQVRSAVRVSLRSVATGAISATATLSSPTPTTSFAGTVSVARSGVAAWGAQQWVVTAPGTTASATRSAVMRARSVVGLRVVRHGGVVLVHGAVRAYNTSSGRYQGWTGRAVAVQESTPTGWRTVRTVLDDHHGNLDVPLRLPVGTSLRLTVGATASIWGAVSAPRAV